MTSLTRTNPINRETCCRFSCKVPLKLKRNDNLLAPGMTVIRRNRDGTITLNEVSNRMRPSYKMQILVVQHLVYSWCDFAWKTTTSLPIHWIGTGEWCHILELKIKTATRAKNQLSVGQDVYALHYPLHLVCSTCEGRCKKIPQSLLREFRPSNFLFKH